MKQKASDADVKAFMRAVFPDAADLAIAAFDEKHVLITATKLIDGLRADNRGLRRTANMRLELHQELDEAHKRALAAYDNLLTSWSELKLIRDGLLIKRHELAEAIVGISYRSPEDNGAWSHEELVKEANRLRAEDNARWQAGEHDPLCSKGVQAGDQTMPCDCDEPSIDWYKKRCEWYQQQLDAMAVK